MPTGASHWKRGRWTKLKQAIFRVLRECTINLDALVLAKPLKQVSGRKCRWGGIGPEVGGGWGSGVREGGEGGGTPELIG